MKLKLKALHFPASGVPLWRDEMPTRESWLSTVVFVGKMSAVLLFQAKWLGVKRR